MSEARSVLPDWLPRPKTYQVMSLWQWGGTRSTAVLSSIAAQVDTDHNNQVTFDEFVKWLETSAPEKARR